MTESQHRLQLDNQLHMVTLTPDGDGFLASVDDRTYHVRVISDAQGQLTLTVDGRRLRAYVAGNRRLRYVGIDGDVWKVQQPDERRRPRGSRDEQGGTLEATMPGLVLDVLVAEGDQVARGDTLVLLEAMKMELRITAPRAGRVTNVHCRAGAVVERGQRLIELGEIIPVDVAGATGTDGADTGTDNESRRGVAESA